MAARWRRVRQATSSNQAAVATKAMAKAKSVEEKKQYSEIVKNLSESLGVFLGIIRDLAPYDFDEDDEDED